MLVALTRFGDAALVLPLAATILCWLLMSGAPRATLWWIIAVSICVGATAILKILLWSCPPAADLHSPSGHTSLAALVYGATALLVVVEVGRWRTAVALAAAGLIATIAVSRVLLDAHSIAEVVLGLLIGGASLALFRHGYLRRRPTRPRLASLFVGLALLMVLLHGRTLRAEELFHRIADYLGIVCR